MGYIVATICFFLASLISGGYIAVGCCIFNWIIYLLQLHWKRIYR